MGEAHAWGAASTAPVDTTAPRLRGSKGHGEGLEARDSESPASEMSQSPCREVRERGQGQFQTACVSVLTCQGLLQLGDGCLEAPVQE